MMTASLISLPPETVREMIAAEDRAQRSAGGGSAFERGAGLAVLTLAALLASMFALALH